MYSIPKTPKSQSQQKPLDDSCFRKSNTILKITACRLTQERCLILPHCPKSSSCAAGCHYLSSRRPTDPSKAPPTDAAPATSRKWCAFKCYPAAKYSRNLPPALNAGSPYFSTIAKWHVSCARVSTYLVTPTAHSHDCHWHNNATGIVNGTMTQCRSQAIDTTQSRSLCPQVNDPRQNQLPTAKFTKPISDEPITYVVDDFCVPCANNTYTFISMTFQRKSSTCIPIMQRLPNTWKSWRGNRTKQRHHIQRTSSDESLSRMTDLVLKI